MRLDDLTLEVRDRSLARVGQVTGKHLHFKGVKRWCGVGEWELNLPGDHAMVPYLATKGSGIILTGPVASIFRPRTADAEAYYEPVYGTIMSGPTSRPQRVRNRQNPDGTYTFTGVTDEVLLAASLAWPSPEVADAAAQTRANDTRTGTTEDLMRQFVAFNIGNGALATTGATVWAPQARLRGLRRFLTLEGVSGARGVSQQKSPRFQNLLELLTEMAQGDPDYGFEVVQVGKVLQFRVLQAADRRGLVRLDVENGTIQSEEVAEAGPTLTDAIVGGQGEGTERTIIQRTTPEAQAAEDEWGIVWERFIDQRDTDDLVELEQSATEALLEGSGGVSVKMLPSDDSTMQYGLHWRQGDYLTAVVLGKETVARSTEAVFVANSSGVLVGTAIGDVSGFTAASAQASKVASLDERVTRLERLDVAPPALVRAMAEWGTKGGPLEHKGTPDGPYANTWAKGLDSGGSIDAHSDPLRILIKEDGIYEVVAQQRAAQANAYIGIGMNGKRETLQDRPQGMWNHDHAGIANQFSNSWYLGLLLAGESVTAGPPSGQGTTMQYNSATFTGTLTVRRIS